MLLHLPPNFNTILSNFSYTTFPKSQSLVSSRRFPARRKSPRISSPYRFRCAKSPSESTTTVDSFTKYSGYLFEGGMSEAEYLEAYNPSKIASIYLRKPYLVLRRLLQIGASFGRWFGFRYLDKVLERSDQKFEVWYRVARWDLVRCRERLVEFMEMEFRCLFTLKLCFIWNSKFIEFVLLY